MIDLACSRTSNAPAGVLMCLAWVCAAVDAVVVPCFELARELVVPLRHTL